MKRSGPVADEGLEMIGSGITFVLRQAILRVELIEFFHATVAFCFRQDRRGCDGDRTRIAVNQGLLLDGQIELKGVQKQIVGKRVELRNGCNHCLTTGLVDVPGVDPAGVNLSGGPGESVLSNTRSKFGAPLGSEFLRIVETDDSTLRVEDDGGSYYRAEERTAACFIESSDALPTTVARFALISGAAEPSHRPRF